MNLQICIFSRNFIPKWKKKSSKKVFLPITKSEIHFDVCCFRDVLKQQLDSLGICTIRDAAKKSEHNAAVRRGESGKESWAH